jgi:hypothetical protein
VRTLPLHIGVAAAYITLGVFVPQVLISWPVGAAFYFLSVWALPTLVRRLR